MCCLLKQVECGTPVHFAGNRQKFMQILYSPRQGTELARRILRTRLHVLLSALYAGFQISPPRVHDRNVSSASEHNQTGKILCV